MLARGFSSFPLSNAPEETCDPFSDASLAKVHHQGLEDTCLYGPKKCHVSNLNMVLCQRYNYEVKL